MNSCEHINRSLHTSINQSFHTNKSFNTNINRSLDTTGDIPPDHCTYMYMQAAHSAGCRGTRAARGTTCWVRTSTQGTRGPRKRSRPGSGSYRRRTRRAGYSSSIPGTADATAYNLRYRKTENLIAEISHYLGLRTRALFICGSMCGFAKNR